MRNGKRWDEAAGPERGKVLDLPVQRSRRQLRKLLLGHGLMTTFDSVCAAAIDGDSSNPIAHRNVTSQPPATRNRITVLQALARADIGVKLGAISLYMALFRACVMGLAVPSP